MSLQVWLPLNKDLSNQGLANVSIINNDATFNTMGKLGGCYYFTPNQWIKISMPEHMTTIKNITVAAWVKSHSNTLALGGISHDSNASLAGISLYTNGWQLSGSGSSYKYITSGITANNQEWHHVACTIADDEIVTYVDGLKIFSTTLTAQGIVYTDITSNHFIEIGCDHPGGDEYFTGYVNDFRIYDHCLSPKEVKEISKGLILHYKLDNGGTGPTNLLKNGFGELGTKNWDNPNNVTTTDLPSANSNIKAKFLNTTSKEFIPVYRNHIYKISTYIKSSTGATTGYTYPSIRVYDIDKNEIWNYQTLVGFNLNTMTTLKQELKSGDTKIYVNDLSAWNANSGTYYNHAAIFSYTDSTGYTYPDGVYTRTTPTFGTGTNAKTNLDKTNNVITLTAAYSGPTIPAGTSVCASTDGSTYFYPFGGITHASIQDWVYKEDTFSAENNRIVAAAYMKVMSYTNSYLAGITLIDMTMESMIDKTKEFDCSGYNYNGTIIGTLTNSTDTPKYSVSVNFINNTDTISPMACFSNGQTLTALTTSIWAKTNTMNSVLPNLISLGENSFWRFRIASATSIWYYIRVGTTQVANTLSVPSSITSTLLDNKWHLYTLVFDQGIAKFYIDSVLIGTGNHTGTATYLTCGSTAWHLAGYTSNAENFIGSLSDFRIYTTAFSAEDIAELYYTAASVDNHGNIYTYEFEEV